MNKNLNENTGLKGAYVFTKAKLETTEHFKLNDQIVALRNAGQSFRHLIDKLHSICKVEKYVLNNIVPTVGRTMIANNLVDSTPDNAMRINYVAVGTNSTTPANGDTQLGTETYRNLVASEINAANVAYVTGFFAATEAVATLRECGLFSNATGTANSGVLFSHAAINIVKSNTETLTLDWTLTIN